MGQKYRHKKADLRGKILNVTQIKQQIHRMKENCYSPSILLDILTYRSMFI